MTIKALVPAALDRLEHRQSNFLVDLAKLDGPPVTDADFEDVGFWSRIGDKVAVGDSITVRRIDGSEIEFRVRQAFKGAGVVVERIGEVVPHELPARRHIVICRTSADAPSFTVMEYVGGKWSDTWQNSSDLQAVIRAILPQVSGKDASNWPNLTITLATADAVKSMPPLVGDSDGLLPSLKVYAHWRTVQVFAPLGGPHGSDIWSCIYRAPGGVTYSAQAARFVTQMATDEILTCFNAGSRKAAFSPETWKDYSGKITGENGYFTEIWVRPDWNVFDVCPADHPAPRPPGISEAEEARLLDLANNWRRTGHEQAGYRLISIGYKKRREKDRHGNRFDVFYKPGAEGEA